MDKYSAPAQSPKPLTGRRVRKIPSTPAVGTSQPPETSAGNFYSRIIKEAMAKFNQATCPKSSSSLGLRTEDESETEEDKGVMKRSSRLTNRPEGEGTSHAIEEVASEAIQEMHEIERKRKGKSVETREVGESQQCFSRVANRESQRNPIVDIYDLTEQMMRRQPHPTIGGV